MAIDEDKTESGIRQKAAYHHGDLKEALISAAQQLVIEKGAENFSLADACRLAGVSTAAPYKHFRHRDEILEIITARAFDTLSERAMEAVERHGHGSIEGIIAMGQAYVTFAVEEQALFRLMFGQNPSLKSAEIVLDDGRECFKNLIEQVSLFCEKNGIDGDANTIAVRLWTFVHGAASLLIDGDYEAVVQDIDVERLIKETAPLLVAG